MHTTQTGPGCGRALALLFALTVPAAADPSWWSDPSFSIWTSTPQNVENGAPVNLGQLKNVADQARRYLDSRLGQADGAGAAVTALCQFTQADNYAPATVGQLKNVAKVFYDRLEQIGYNWQTGSFGSTPYPWTGTVNPENQAPCNIGQLKNLFTFDITPAFLAIDGDLDGMPSWWEKASGLNPSSAADASFDSDSDLLTNLQEYQIGLNPLSSHSGGTGQPSDYQESLALPTFDTDRDGLPNAGDAVPTDPLLMFPPVAESRYALIDLGPGTAHSVNASGQVLRAWQTTINGGIINHAEVMAPLGTGDAPSPVPETHPINAIHGLAADGTVFFSAEAFYYPIYTPRVFWSRLSASAEMVTHSAPTTSWVEGWTVQSVYASGPVTQGGSLLNGGTTGGATGFWAWIENEASMYGGASGVYGGTCLRWGSNRITGGVNPGGNLAENIYFWQISPCPVPGSQHNQYVVFPDPYTEFRLLQGGWAAPSHQGAAVHFLTDFTSTDYTTSPPVNPGGVRTYSFTPNIEVASPAVEALPQAFTGPLATADVPSIPQQSMGPVIFTGINENANCIAWVRTPTGWQQTEVFSSSGTTEPMSLGMPENHPVAPLGRPATAANGRGEFLRGNTLWRNGNAHQIGDLISLPPDTGFIASDLNSQGLICGTLVTQAGPRAAILLPIEMKVVDRDDPKKKWADAKDFSSSKPNYAGESCGDMVSWKLGGTASWSSMTFTWTAEGPGGETVTGPMGAGKNEWKIADGDEDTANDWLKWRPGKWKIKVQIGSTQTEFEQEVGWRTEDYVVIGQIVETHTHDGDAPPLVAVGNNFWEISSPVALYRRAVLYDMLDLPVFDGLPDAARDALMVTLLPITAKLSEAWFGYWYLMPAGLTPQGPFTQAYPSGNGSVQNGHRFWALQHIFNVSPDTPLVPPTFNADTFDTIKDAEQYRVIHRYKSKFLVTSDGKIDSGKVVRINHVAEGGPTKMNFGIAAGEFSPIWNNPAYTFFSLPKQPSETNQYQGAHAVSQDGTKLSYYATGRVGAGGQNVNWRLMGKDAP